MSRSERHGDAARQLHAAVRARLAVAVSDLFLPDDQRLSEWQRTTMTALLARLVRSVEDDLRSALAERLEQRNAAAHAALAAMHVEIAVPILRASAALHDPDLIALLLRRVEEHRLHRAAHPGGAMQQSLLTELVRDPDPGLAEAAMALLIAQSRRLDRFQDPVIANTELPAELEHRLVWTVAAALRSYLIERHEVAPADADTVLAEAVAARLAVFDEEENLETRSLQLVHRLHELGRLDGAFAAHALAASGLPLFLASIAFRCGIGMDAAWEMFCDPRRVGAPLLMRAAGLDRNQAAESLVILSTTASADEEDILERQLRVFDSCSDANAQDTLQFWRADPTYRAAVRRLAPASPGVERP